MGRRCPHSQQAATQRSATSTSITPMLTSAKRLNTGATVTPTATLTISLLLHVSTNPTSNMSTNVSATPVAMPTLRTLSIDDAELMLINQDIVPLHHHHLTLVLQPVYKQFPPEDIVHLKASDKLIVAIPATTNTTDKDVLLVFHKYYLLSRE